MMLAAGEIVDVDKEKKWGENAALRNGSVEGKEAGRYVLLESERKKERLERKLRIQCHSLPWMPAWYTL